MAKAQMDQRIYIPVEVLGSAKVRNFQVTLWELRMAINMIDGIIDNTTSFKLARSNMDYIDRVCGENNVDIPADQKFDDLRQELVLCFNAEQKELKHEIEKAQKQICAIYYRDWEFGHQPETV